MANNLFRLRRSTIHCLLSPQPTWVGYKDVPLVAGVNFQGEEEIRFLDKLLIVTATHNPFEGLLKVEMNVPFQ